MLRIEIDVILALHVSLTGKVIKQTILYKNKNNYPKLRNEPDMNANPNVTSMCFWLRFNATLCDVYLTFRLRA